MSKLLVLPLLAALSCTKTTSAETPLPRPPRVLTIDASAPRQRLMVVLHGVGSNADNIFPLAKTLSSFAPDADVLVPDGLFPWSGGPNAREWYSLQNIDDLQRADRVEPAGVALSAWLDEELAKRKLDGSKLIVVGFSQGAGLAQWLAVRRTPAPVAISLSGRFAVQGDQRAEGARVLIVHGTNDPVVPVSNAEASRAALLARGANVEVELIPGLGHSVDARVLERVQRFLTP